jgi:ubiquinone/menaquinone biosynthesis C-methylase UbiE
MPNGTNKRMQDTQHLRDVAYKDAANLNARIAFWQLYGQSRDPAFTELFDNIDAPNDAAVLDIGCGPAHYWQWGLDNGRVPHSWTATLTDLSTGMLDEARRTLSGYDRNFTFEIADVCDLQYADESFDVVTANYMLYHASSQSKALSEIARVLKPGGKLYAKTNSVDHITEFLDLQHRFVSDHSQRANIGLAHAAFTLENGGAMIDEHFSSHEIITEKGTCQATDPQIVIDYANSMDADLQPEPLADFVTAQIKSQGHFAVTRFSGMFIAVK